MKEAILVISKEQPGTAEEQCRDMIFWADSFANAKDILDRNSITTIISDQALDLAAKDQYDIGNIALILCKAGQIEWYVNLLKRMCLKLSEYENEERTLQHVAGELALSINHFLLNVITVINLEIDMLRMEEDIKDESGKRLDYIEEQIDVIVETIERLRALKNSPDDIEFPFDVKEETINFLPLMRDYFMNHGVTIKVKVPDELPLIKADRTALRILFISSMLFFYHSKAENEKGIVMVNLMDNGGNLGIRIECPFTNYIEMFNGKENADQKMTYYHGIVDQFSQKLGVELHAGSAGNTAYIAFDIKK